MVTKARVEANVIKLSTEDYWKSSKHTKARVSNLCTDCYILGFVAILDICIGIFVWQKHLCYQRIFLSLVFMRQQTYTYVAKPHSMKMSCRTEPSHCDCIFFLALSSSGIFLFFSPVPFHPDTDGYLWLQFWNLLCNGISILLSDQEECYLQ